MSIPRGLRNNNEEWKDIPGYEGKYRVSNLGRVKSLPKYHFKTERILKGEVDKDGYIKVVLCPDSKTRNKRMVHRLVASAFIDNPNNLPETDHINTIKNDNRVENLRWASRSSNQLNDITRKRTSDRMKGIVFSKETLKKMSDAKKGKKMSKSAIIKSAESRCCPVVMIGLGGNRISTFKSIKEAAQVTNISPKRISDVCLNKRNKAGGFVWRKI